MENCYKRILILFSYILLYNNLNAQLDQTISSSLNKSFYIKPNKTLWAAGEGSLGNGYVGGQSKFNRISKDTYLAICGDDDLITFAIKSDSTLCGWGNNQFGQLGNGTIGTSVYSPVKLADGKFIFVTTSINSEFSITSLFSLAIKDDHTLWGWGKTRAGLFLDTLNFSSNNEIFKSSPTKISNEKYNMAVTDGSTIVAIKSDSTIWSWGVNSNGQIGDGTTIDRNLPVLISKEKFILVQKSFGSAYALTSNGELYTWGNNNNGQLGLGDKLNRRKPEKLIFKNAIKYISASKGVLYFIDSFNDIYFVGSVDFGQTGKTYSDSTLIPKKILYSGARSISASISNLIIKKIDGSIEIIGDNSQGQLGLGIESYSTFPSLVLKELVNQNFDDIFSTSVAPTDNLINDPPRRTGIFYNINLARKKDSTYWGFGFNRNGILCTDSNLDIAFLTKTNIPKNIIKTSISYTHALGISDSGELYGWGINNNKSKGAFGSSVVEFSNIPTKINNDKYNFVTTRFGYSFFIKNDSSLWASGVNSNYVLGTGNDSSYNNMVEIDKGSKYLAVFPFNNTTYAIKSDSSLWAWGIANGQLGNNQFGYVKSPIKISSIKFKKLHAVIQYFGFTYAIANDSTLWGWGYNVIGQSLQENLDEISHFPTQLSKEKWNDITGTNFITYGIKSDSTLWAWGQGIYYMGGLFGQSSSISTSKIPVKVSDNKFIKIIHLGNVVIALRNDGKIVSFGSRMFGGIGDGNLGYIIKPNVIYENPPLPFVSDTSFCLGSKTSPITAKKTNEKYQLLYYKESKGGIPSKVPFTPNTDKVDSINFYVSQTYFIGDTIDEGYRAKISVKINPNPSMPIVKDTSYCNNSPTDTLRAIPTIGNVLLWYGVNAIGGTATNTAIKPLTTSVGVSNYYVSQLTSSTGCEGPRAKIEVTIKPIPNAPTLSRDSENNLLTGAAGTSWFKDGTILNDTAQKYKPTTPGSYTAKTTLNGCSSSFSTPYYYLVTSIINLSSNEFIKLAPNPVKNQMNIDFVVKGYQRLNVDFYELSTGLLKYTNKGVFAGSQLFIGQLSPGTYVVSVRSDDGKVSHKLKIVKL